MNKVFENEEFLNDLYRYSLVKLLLSNENYTLRTDDENYFLLRNGKNTPVWVWNTDNLTEEKLDELVKEFKFFFKENGFTQFTVKEVVFKKLLEEYKDLVAQNLFKEKGYYLKMRAYVLNNPVKPKNGDVGFLRHPREDELELLARFFKEDCEDTLTEESYFSVTEEEYLKEAEKRLKDENFFFLEVDGKVVSQVSFKVDGDDARLSHVFTPREARGNGYAKVACYKLSVDLLNKGLTPVLYADADYAPSNKCYLSVGFESVGDLYNLRLGKGKETRLYR